MSEATPAAILQIGAGFMASKTLLSAIEVGVFNTLAKGPADLATLQQKLGLHPRSARDFLDALVSLKLLERNNGVYSNTVETDLFLDNAKPSYVGGLLEMANARLYRFRGSLTEALKTANCKTKARAAGTTSSPRCTRRRQAPRLPARDERPQRWPGARDRAEVEWRRDETFMDLGTAQGELPVILAKAHPHLRGIGSTFRWFDLCSRSSSPATGFRPVRSRPATSSRTTCRKPT